MNLGELRTSFTTILNRRDCTTAERDEYITQGLAWAQRKLKGVPAVRKAVYLEIDDETNYETGGLPIPSDLIKLDTITVRWPDGREQTLTRKGINEVMAGNGVEVTPSIFAQRGGEYILSPKPPNGTYVRIDYYAEMAGLEEETDTNIASEIVPYIIVYAALTYAGRSKTDKRRGEWQASRDEILQEVLDQAQEDELSGSAAVSPVYDWPSDE